VLSHLSVRMNENDEFRPDPTAHGTDWYRKTHLQSVELEKSNSQAYLLDVGWTGPQLLLHHHSALGPLKSPLEWHIFHWIES
jgi:hypothetical protein